MHAGIGDIYVHLGKFINEFAAKAEFSSSINLFLVKQTSHLKNIQVSLHEEKCCALLSNYHPSWKR